jgi:hypothetical protein
MQLPPAANEVGFIAQAPPEWKATSAVPVLADEPGLPLETRLPSYRRFIHLGLGIDRAKVPDRTISFEA